MYTPPSSPFLFVPFLPGFRRGDPEDQLAPVPATMRALYDAERKLRMMWGVVVLWAGILY